MIRFRFFARSAAIIILGVVLPVTVLFQAYVGLQFLNREIAGKSTQSDASAIYEMAKNRIRDPGDGNDYALFSLIYSEQSNRNTIINKQLLKVVIMQIGFAVISLGLMFIVLGINDGGATAGAEGAGLKLDFRSGSTGVVTFVVGALMATAGGVMKNEYQTVGIPQYVQRSKDSNNLRAVNAFKECSTLKRGVAEECFMDSFKEINKDYL
ncbi:hypothetical protein ACI2TO_22835 [Ralstonia nicotianae]